MLNWFLFLCVTSVFAKITLFGRSAEHKKDVLDLVSNHIILDHKIIKSNGTTSNYEEINILDNVIATNNINVTHKQAHDSISSKNKRFQEINKVDNGTALILTQYIREGRAQEARKASEVNPKFFLGFKSYSGFFTVNETYNSNVFTWYFPVLNKNVSDSPWIIWLQGGPGASSLIGLFDEIGPFTYINDSLIPNQFTWLQNHSLLFIDNPVGTGYSFTDHEEGYVSDMATYSKHLFKVLKQFLEIFPELRTAPLYVAGESYAGKYAPALAMEIHRHKDNLGAGINFQGLILGNAYVDPEMMTHLPQIFYYFGLIEREQGEMIKPIMTAFQEDIDNKRSVAAKNKWTNLVGVFRLLIHQEHMYNFLKDEVTMGRFSKLLKNSEIKRAIHVGDIHYSWVNITVNTILAPDFLSTTKPLIERLLNHYKVLMYCGQLDLMLPCVFTSEHYRTWRWNGREQFLNSTRHPYMFDKKLCGYHKSGGNLTEVIVRNAGHEVPMDMPAPTQNMIAQWTHEKPISSLHYAAFTDVIVRQLIERALNNSNSIAKL